MVSNRSTVSEDIENGVGGGISTETEKELAKFNREADAIDKVYVWANKSINTISGTLSDPTLLPSVNPQLDTIEQKLDNVRVRLQRISKENKELAAAKNTPPATMRIRITRTTKLANDFMAVITSLQKVRESHKSAATDSVKRDMLKANPQATDAQMDKALENPESDQLDVVMIQEAAEGDNAQLRNQVDDLRHRNRDIHNLSKNIVQLHQMFQDMSILVNGQQELINEIEHNVTEVKAGTKKAGEELEVALAHQRSARKKKMCICILVFCIIVAVILAIVIPICIQGNCNFGSSGGSDDAGNEGSSGSPPPPASNASDPTPNPDGGSPTTRELDFVVHNERRHKLFAQLDGGQQHPE